ncbi:MAG: helix-turn-helix domain-containing protein [Bacteroidetes bacterium]|nr:helix-turn-helix domain-containing protein [Bacteroidota bacterium]
MDIPSPFIGQKIKKIRELKNLTQSHIANELGITQSAYSKMEMGESDITFQKLTRISEILGMSPDEIASFNEQMIFNVMHNQTGNGFVVQKGLSDNEKRLYEDQIQTLKEEVQYLKKVVDSLLIR